MDGLSRLYAMHVPRPTRTNGRTGLTSEKQVSPVTGTPSQVAGLEIVRSSIHRAREASTLVPPDSK